MWMLRDCPGSHSCCVAELRFEPKPCLLPHKGMPRPLWGRSRTFSPSPEMQAKTSGLGSCLSPGKGEGIGHPAPGEQYVGNNLGRLLGEGGEKAMGCLLGDT